MIQITLVKIEQILLNLSKFYWDPN